MLPFNSLVNVFIGGETICWFCSYGSILENLQTRPDIIEKIKGCVIDSGADPEISPQVCVPLLLWVALYNLM